MAMVKKAGLAQSRNKLNNVQRLRMTTILQRLSNASHILILGQREREATNNEIKWNIL